MVRSGAAADETGRATAHYRAPSAAGARRRDRIDGPVPSPRRIVLALLPFALHGLAREVDAALGLLLRASAPPPSFPAEVGRVLAAGGGGVWLRVGLWIAGGAVVWLVLAAERTRGEGRGLGAALGQEAGSFGPLYLRPALTLLALASLALQPAFPYVFTLPVALGQDWGLAQDVAALAAFLAARAPAVRLPAPGTGAVFFMSFLAYALLTPDWARQWEGHPGNEPKYLRMAVAIGHELTLDAEGVTTAMERLEPPPLAAAAAAAGRGLVRESGRMASALLRGEGVGRGSIAATRVTRQTIRGKEGGVYYVLAPGPSLLLAPTLRLDRALNRARGVEGRLAASVLAWNALAAALVAALFRLARDTTGRPGLAAALALGFALVPPFVFYAYQFYPELPGALVLALLAHRLACAPRLGSPAAAWVTGGLLAALPWLHQKFLPVWLVLVATCAWTAWRGRAPRAAMLGLLVPQAATLYLTALYNFAIAGSVRPDALYLAWGPAGVTTARLGQGLLGLLLDARYGLLPYAPVYLLAGAGLLLGGARRLALVLPAAAVYYVTVASADNWAGAVCNLGRYLLPVAPLAVALVALAVARVADRRGAVALVLMLAGWTAVLAVLLFRDPHSANDGWVLLARSAFADGSQYVPNLHLRSWSDAAPGLAARVLAWAALALAVAGWTGGAAAGRPGPSPGRVLAAVVGVVLAVGSLLERWPSAHAAPRFGDAVPAGAGATVFVSGRAVVRGDEVHLGEGRTELLVRSSAPRASVRAVVGGDGLVRLPGRLPIVARPAGALVDLPLAPRYTVGGTGETFHGVALEVEGAVLLRFPAGP